MMSPMILTDGCAIAPIGTPQAAASAVDNTVSCLMEWQARSDDFAKTVELFQSVMTGGGSHAIVDGPTAGDCCNVREPLPVEHGELTAEVREIAVTKPAIEHPVVVDRQVDVAVSSLDALPVEHGEFTADAREIAVAKPAIEHPVVVDRKVDVAVSSLDALPVEHGEFTADAREIAVAKPAIEHPVVADRQVVVVSPIEISEPNRVVETEIDEGIVLPDVRQMPASIPVIAKKPIATGEKPVVESAAIEEKPTIESDEADVVLQALPTVEVKLAQSDTPVGIADGVFSASQVSASVSQKVSAATSASVLVEAAQAVVDTMLVSPGLLRGDGEVRVVLKPDVLQGTEIRLTSENGAVTICFMPTVENIAVLLERCQPQLAQHLAEHVHSVNISVRVSRNDGKSRV